MTSQIKLLSTKMNVSGAEKQLSDFIVQMLIDQGLHPKTDNLGNVILRNESYEKNKLMICAPLDNPGLLTLYSEKSKAFLSYTEKIDENVKSIKELMDEEGNTFSSKASKEYPDYMCVTKKDPLLGQPFRIPTSISEEDGTISGRFVSRYALQSVLLELASLTKTHNIAICFTTGFHSLAKSENCLAKMYLPENMLLLGFAEAKDSPCLLLVKDGKCFSHKELVNTILLAANNCKTTIEKKVLDKAATKAETIAVPGGIKVASLALPCQNPDKNDEAIQGKRLSELKNILNEIILSI